MTEAVALAPDPSPRLDATFRALTPRMQGLAFVNPDVDVEAVGFAPWQGHWLGVMVTPWFMNLMLLPRDPTAWEPLPAGAKRSYRFPAGVYEFVGAHDATLGEYQLCSLFSPLLQFDDHAAARLVARLAREALFDPANAQDDAGRAEAAAMPLQRRLEAPLSKRDFLRGRFLADDDADRR
jgi:[NiFe] hydrogenase assembly HybE family chaperone